MKLFNAIVALALASKFTTAAYLAYSPIEVVAPVKRHIVSPYNITNSTVFGTKGSSGSFSSSTSSSAGSSVTVSSASSSKSDSCFPSNENEKLEAFTFVKKFWTSFINPTDDAEALKINSTYFTEDCKGRVSLTRDFEGDELNTEYIFGLFSNVFEVKFRMVGIPLNYTMLNFLYDDMKAISSVNVEFYIPQADFYIPIQIDLWFVLVKTNGYLQIAEYDGIFRNFDRAYEETNAYVQELIGEEYGSLYPNKTSLEIYTGLAIESICEVHQEYCLGENQQYSSYETCVAFLSTVRLGQGFEGGRDTIFCRNLHQVMLPFRPAVHCPHIGPTGGDMCTDTDTSYNEIVDTYSTYFDPLFISI
ncbi:hypothetical protein DASC09_025270 [Saccharomycopsis crataegensis]|uniref:Uncharacterized protein n=1 Tax=Saccharomycopsis crataegensis TaxID=43959 RepID=A0AAV5QK69_9ASCO|nr:hypothetical protein DASC09_025270 [Saccharomycopsis crataegensis]